jgi:hypothetical protein
MKKSKNKTEFSKWLEKSALDGLLHRGGVRLRHLDKIQTEIFVANNKEGDPLCIFEVGKDSDVSIEYEDFLLKKMPSWCLNLPGYTILYRKTEGQKSRKIINFRVRKFTPKERFVGDFSPREFAGFLASTIAFCRKKHEKEQIHE